jgi:acetyltransferase-like isoleucine patch superfamily enzyme
MISNLSIIETDNIGKNVTVGEFAIIKRDVIIGENVHIGEGTIVYPNVIIESNTFIGPYCILGEPAASFYDDPEKYEFKKTVIGRNSLIRSNTIIYEDVIIGENLQTGHRMTIREGTRIGMHCRIGTLCDLQGKLTIGNHVNLHSNVHLGQLSNIEDFVWIYPYVVLTNDPPHGKLKGVIVRKFAQIATRATIMPGIEIGENALIGACTLVRKNVPPERVIVGNPGKDICSVRDLKDEKGNCLYPWKDFLKDYRGYPWQQKNDNGKQ